MKIAYFGCDFFSSCLTALLEQGHEVMAAFSFEADNRYVFNDYMTAICNDAGIAFSIDPINADVIDALARQGCDVLITAAYLHKIPPLHDSGIRGINIHPTLLPTGRGRWPLPWVLLNNLGQSGVSFHKLSERFDAGPLLLQQSFPVAADENLESLSVKSQWLAKSMTNALFADFDQYWNNTKPQSGKASYWPLPTDHERTLDWTATAADIDRRSRAFGKYGCFAQVNNQWHHIFELTSWKQEHNDAPGETVHLTNTETIVACHDGLVCLRYFNPMNIDMANSAL